MNELNPLVAEIDGMIADLESSVKNSAEIPGLDPLIAALKSVIRDIEILMAAAVFCAAAIYWGAL